MGAPLNIDSMAELALFLCQEGDDFLAKGDFARAEVRLAQALSAFRQLNAENLEYINWILYNLGVVVLQQKRQWEAENFLEASAFVQIRGGSTEATADKLTELARRMTSFNAYDRARWLCGQAFEMYKALGLETKTPELQKFIEALDENKPEAAQYRPGPHHFAIHVRNIPEYDLVVLPSGMLEWHVLNASDEPVPLDLFSWRIFSRS